MLTICSLVARAGGSEDQQVQAMADRMVEYACQCMKNRNRVSPFESAFFFSFFFSIVIFFFCSFFFTGEASRQGMYFRGGVSVYFFFLFIRCLPWLMDFFCFLFPASHRN